MANLWDNPMGTDGFEFVEYTAPDVKELTALFERLGFRAVGRHRSKDVTLFRQGEVNFVVNAEPDSHGSRFAKAHGPSACAMAFRVKDAAKAFKRALELGAKPFANHVGPMELNIPAIEGIGGSVIYLVDRYGAQSIYDVDFVATDPARGFAHEGAGLTYIDHVTHNVFRGNMDQWAGYLRKALRLPRDPLFRHRRQADRPQIARDDQPLRQDPHPDQRILRRQIADRGISRMSITAKASSTSLWARTTSIPRSKPCARAALRSRTRPTPITSASTIASRATAKTSAGSRATAS